MAENLAVAQHGNRDVLGLNHRMTCASLSMLDELLIRTVRSDHKNGVDAAEIVLLPSPSLPHDFKVAGVDDVDF